MWLASETMCGSREMQVVPMMTVLSNAVFAIKYLSTINRVRGSVASDVLLAIVGTLSLPLPRSLRACRF